ASGGGSGSLALGSCAWTRARASPFPAAASRASLLACLRRESSDGRAGRSRAWGDITPPFTKRLYPLRSQAERRCTAPRFRLETDGNSSLAAGRTRPVRRADKQYRG